MLSAAEIDQIKAMNATAAIIVALFTLTPAPVFLVLHQLVKDALNSPSVILRVMQANHFTVVTPWHLHQLTVGVSC